LLTLPVVAWLPKGATTDNAWAYYVHGWKIIYLNHSQLTITRTLNTLFHEFVHYIFETLKIAKFLDGIFDKIDSSIFGVD